MDSRLPSYEAAMRDAREYLRRRDLTSQDEIPLYFAWERLYAAANVNLSTDFLNETRAELRARQQARLTPRQGLPPPLFTSFDKVNRKSLQSSAFLRSGLSSDAAIEMMARRYRREAEKLRSSREKIMVNSVGEAGKRLKKSKRCKKTPQQEVDELLEALESPGSPRRSEFATSTLSKDRVGTGSDDGGKQAKKINRSRPSPEREVEELLAKFEHSNTVRNRVNAVKPKDGVDFTGGKDSFADELAGGNAGKAAELRRSSFSMGNPAADPSLVNVEDVAAFAAQVSDLKMQPTADTAALSSKLGPNGLASSGLAPATKGAKRVNGGGKVRKSSVGRAGEADTTFDTSLESSGSDEDLFDASGSLRSSAVSTSPTSRRSTAHTSEWVHDDDENCQVDDEQWAARSSATDEKLLGRPAVKRASHSTSFNTHPGSHGAIASTPGAEQSPVQLSHAVGDMQVKINGKEIEVTFKGSLNSANTGEVNNSGLNSERDQSAVKQPSATQKVFSATGPTDRRASDKEDERATVEQPDQIRHASRGDANLPRKQSSVRFSGVEGDGEARPHGDEVREGRDAPVASLQTRQEAPSRQVHSASAHSSAATPSDAEEDVSYDNEEGVELADRSSNSSKTLRLLSQREDVHDSEDLSENERGTSIARGQNRVLPEGGQGRHRLAAQGEDSKRRQDMDQAATGFGPTKRRNHSSSESFDGRTHLAGSRHGQDGEETGFEDEECESEGMNIPPEQHPSLEQRKRQNSQPGARPNTNRTAVERNPSSGNSLDPSMELSAEESEVGSGEEPTRVGYRNEMASEEWSVDSAQATQLRDNKKVKQSRRSRSQQQNERDETRVRDSRDGRAGSRQGQDDEVLMDKTPHSSVQEHRHKESTRRKASTNTAIEENLATTRKSRGRHEQFDNHPRSSEPRSARATRDPRQEEGESDGSASPSELSTRRRSTRSRSQRTEAPANRRSMYDESDVSSSDDWERARTEIPKTTKRTRPRSKSDQIRSGPQKASSEMSSQDSSDDGAHETTPVHDNRRRSRNQHVVVEESGSDNEDFSDGPDTPAMNEYHHQSRHRSIHQQRRIPRADHAHSKRPSSRHTSSRHKQRSHSSDSSSDSTSDDDSRIEVEKPDRRHRPDTAERSRSNHSTTRDPQRSSRYSANSLRDRDHHLAAAMESPPKRSKPEIRSKETKPIKSKHDSKPVAKLPEGIVWPPGMEAECIARLGLDGHHPIAPPGLEHLVTDEQWGDYWTWLHWYSSWQMWYMKNGKKPKRSSDKEKRRRRHHTESDESPDTEAGRYDRKSQRNNANSNANWWVDVGPSKRKSRRSRS